MLSRPLKSREMIPLGQVFFINSKYSTSKENTRIAQYKKYYHRIEIDEKMGLFIIRK